MTPARGRRFGAVAGALTGVALLASPAWARPAAAARPADVPVDPGREQARTWALEELGKREYAQARPGLVERALAWLFERLNSVTTSTNPVSVVVLTVLVLVIAALIAWAVHRAGGIRRTARVPRSGVFERPDTSAAEHREAAERHAGAGRWGAAVLERFRAVARTLEESAVLEPQPGRTADELARDAGTWLPDLAADLAAGARLFDDVCYGDRTVGADAYATMRTLDDHVRRARPVSHTRPAGAQLTVPS